jgi:hypothetical protein
MWAPAGAEGPEPEAETVMFVRSLGASSAAVTAAPMKFIFGLAVTGAPSSWIWV